MMRKLNLRISTPLRALLITGVCGVSVVFVAVSVRRKIRLIQEPFNERAFDAQVWRAADTRQHIAQRAQMVGSLQRTLYSGMTETQVKMLFGPPDAEQDITSYVPPSQAESAYKFLEYDMGRVPMKMAEQHLHFSAYFDSTGHYIFSSILKDWRR